MQYIEVLVMENLSKELVGASSIPLILSILEEGENYGYMIIQRVKEISEEQIEWKDGTLYPILHKLEKKGLIESFWQASETGRKRKYYRLLQGGKTVLAAEKQNWLELNQMFTRLWKIQPTLG